MTEVSISEPQDRRPARRCSDTCRLVGLGAALIAVLLGVVAWTLYDARAAARRVAVQETGNIALTLEGEIGRMINTLDLSLRSVVRGMATPGLAAMDPAVRRAILFNGAMEAADIGRVFIVDAAGHGIAFSDPPGPLPLDISDRDVFRRLRARADPGLVISAPLTSGSNGARSLVLARRINGADGSFAGAAVAVLPLRAIEQLFAALAIGRRGIVSVFDTDGRLIVHRPDLARPLAPLAPIRALFAGTAPASGNFERTSIVDGVPRLYSYRRVGRLPLVVNVGFATADVYAGWAEKTAILGGALLVLLLAGTGLAWLLWRQMWRRAAAEAAAMAAAREHALALAPLHTLFANTADSMLIARVHPSGDVSYETTNPVWERLTGVAARDAIGRTPQACLPPQLAADTLADWYACLRLRRAHRVTFRSEPPGIERDWEAVIVPVFDDNGVIHRLVSIGRDVTERNMLEATLRQAHRAEAVGQLTAGVAHDFNNLLQAIVAAIEMLDAQSGLDADGQECVAVAGDAARRGAALVHRLLAFSRKQALHPSVLDPARLLAEIAPLIGRVVGPGIRVEARVGADAGPVCADGDQLGDCLLNLALNARDAMPGGGALRLSVEAARPETAGLPPGEYTRFAVADDGTGMSAATLARALEPFFTTKPIGEGTGLGLPMVQGFARQSGGDVRIESAPGRGTTVAIWLPRAGAEAARTAEPAPEAGQGHGRVLLVDDEAFVRQMLTLLLAKAGFSPLALATGDKALALLRAGEPCDLLVTDQSMPGLSGGDLIRAATTLRPALPALLITGYDKVSGLDELPTQVTVLQKPFGREAFLHQVQATLGITLDLSAETEPEEMRWK